MKIRASTLALVGAYIAASAGILYALNYGGVRLLFTLVALVSGAFLGWLLYWLNERDILTFSHVIVAWLIVNGTCVMWGVLYLAVTGADQIAETLGRYVVTELLGTVGVALAKSVIENLSKNNNWPDKKSGIKTDL
ncbi:MAG TPA: hypothetical protein IAC21_06625 [Candidatus Enterenecus merdae]|nr:hypothetical protein [Candidatus Enterenecus merdae]